MFISYSRKDQTYVERLVAYLTDAGIPVWVDYDTPYGDRWEQVIKAQLDRCAAVLVVMTPDAEASEWVSNETHYAEDRGTPILQLLLLGQPFLRYASRQYEDVTGATMPRPRFMATLFDVTGTTPHAVSPQRTAAEQSLDARLLRVLGRITDPILSVAYTPDDRHIITGDGEGGVCRWSAHTGDLEVLYRAESKILSIAVSGRGIVAVAGFGGERVVNGEVYRGHYGAVTAVGFVRLPIRGHDCVISTGHDAKLTIRVIGTPGRFDITWPTGIKAEAMAVSPDHAWVAVAGQGPKVGLAHLRTSLSYLERHVAGLNVPLPEDFPINAIQVGGDWVDALAWSPNGGTLAVGARDDSISLIALSNGTSTGVKVFGRHDDWTLGLAFSPDGRRLASASADGTVRLWDVSSGGQMALATFTGHEGPVRGVAFSADGRTLVSAGDDGTVRLWNTARL